VDEAPTMNRNAVEVGPNQQRTGEHWAQAILSCSAGKCGTASGASRSLLPAPALGWREKSRASASNTRCSSPPSRNWSLDRTRSLATARPDIDTSGDTSSSGPAAGW
jgi:hypothetical protein